MSFWRKWFGGGKDEKEPPSSTRDAAPEPVAEPKPSEPADALTWLETVSVGETTEAEVRQRWAEAQAKTRSTAALQAAARLCRKEPRWRALRLEVAQAFVARGRDTDAMTLLAIFDEETPKDGQVTTVLSAWMTAAEIEERAGRGALALALYERVLARNIDHPRAAARAARLREIHHRAGAAGAAHQVTLMGGALAEKRSRYRIERELGRGGAGTVFAAIDVPLGRRVALKVYHEKSARDRDRLRAEARIPAGLLHAGVVRIFDVDPELGAIAMEWVAGGSLRRRLDQVRDGEGEAISEADAYRWIQSSAEALAFVRDAGFVHRDFKPSNVLIRPDQRCVLTDFGLALPIGEKDERGDGTLRYAPPEQRNGHAAATAADVHALGVTVAEIMTVMAEPPTRWIPWVERAQDPDPAQRPSLEALAATFAA